MRLICREGPKLREVAAEKKKGSESGEGGVKEKWKEGVERGHPR